MGVAIYWTAPAEEPFPPEWHGKPVFVPPAAGRASSRMRRKRSGRCASSATPVADLSGPMPYLVAQSLFDPEYPDGRRYYWKSAYLLRRRRRPRPTCVARYAASRPSP